MKPKCRGEKDNRHKSREMEPRKKFTTGDVDVLNVWRCPACGKEISRQYNEW